MANFLKDFLDGLGSGLTNSKGVSGDFQHANKIFTDSNYRLAPKVKFLYHVVFNINPSALKTSTFDQNHKTQISLLVKSTDLPKFKISTDTVHQYNRKKQVQTKLEYDPVTIKFHDDNLGISTQLWSLYYGYYYADSAHGGSAGSVPKAGATGQGGFMGVMGSLASSLVPQIGGLIGGVTDRGGSSESTVPAAYYRNTYSNETRNAFRYGLDNDASVPFFSSIQIFQMARQTYQAYTLINPIITNWQHDTLAYEENGTVENSMTINYEAVFYGQGAVSVGDPKGFATGLYDRSPSPLSIAGGGNAALLGAGGVLSGGANVLGDLASGRAFANPAALIGTLSKGANVLRNSKELTKSGVKDELFSVVKSAAVPAVGGLLLHSFPKSGGTGQDNTTVAVPYNGGE
jgi:hypothetical protein